MNVVWTPTAYNSLQEILDYLQEHWNKQIAHDFLDLVDQNFRLITSNPEMFPISKYDSQSRAAVLTKHITLFYRIIQNTLEIELLWNNLRNPRNLKGYKVF